MTTLEFDALPLLVRRQQVLRATGWSRETLETLVENGTVHFQKLKGQTQRAFFKEEIAKFVRPATV